MIRDSIRIFALIASAAVGAGTGPVIAQAPQRPAGDGAGKDGITSGIVPVKGGEIYYEAKGDGPTVILLHAGLLDSRMWDEQFDLLATDYRVIRFDARGCGRSSASTETFSHYEDLHALMTALGLKRATLVGLSQGARTSLDFAIAYPRMVEGIVAAAPGMSGWPFKDRAFLEQYKAMQAAAAAEDDAAYVDLFLRSWTDGPKRKPENVDPAVRDRVRQMAAENVAKARRVHGLVEEIGAAARLRDLRTRILAIVGDQDMSDIHAVVDALARQVPGTKKVLIPGAGHMINLEKPVRFNALLLGFLDGKKTDTFKEMPSGRTLRGLPALEIVNGQR